MKKKVLLINGSPKVERSNTLRLTRAFIEGLSKVHELEIDEIVISKLEIRPCVGCLNCWKRTPGKCIHNDEMSTWIDKIVTADIILWSFPLYYYSLPGKLKMFLDRQCCTNKPDIRDRTDGIGNGTHAFRHERSHQRHVLISTCGHYSANGNYKAVKAQFDLVYGFENYTTLFCGQGEMMPIPFFQERVEQYLGYCREAGEEFGKYETILKGTRDKLDELLMPKKEFEDLANAYYTRCEQKAAARAAEEAAKAAEKAE